MTSDVVQHRKSIKWLLVLDGLTPYEEAYALQLALVQAREKGLDKDVLICLEHQPVFTLGRRGGRGGLKVSEAFLKSHDISIIPVERGGDITYHGPGQLVLYPIMHLRKAEVGVVEYVSRLEEVMIRTAGDWSICAERNPLNRGVYVGGRKLGSVGIAVRHGVSFHGLALNVNTNLEHFGWIDPCGLRGVSVASLAQIRGEPIDMHQARLSLLSHVEDLFDTGFTIKSLEEIKNVIQRPFPPPGCG